MLSPFKWVSQNLHERKCRAADGDACRFGHLIGEWATTYLLIVGTDYETPM
jgi:hypothetical protein